MSDILRIKAEAQQHHAASPQLVYPEKGAAILRQGTEFLAATLSFHGRPVVFSTGSGGDEVPLVVVADQDDEVGRARLTTVRFPDMVGWWVFTAQFTKGDLKVVFFL
jgi:hypothetical protein